MKYIIAVLFFLTGCASVKQQDVDTSWFSKPEKGNAGVYFYQWKTMIWGSGSDVKLVIDDVEKNKINTGEWSYIEVPAGKHKVRVKGGLFPMTRDYQFNEGKNYFFRGFLLNASDNVIPVYDTKEIKSVTKNIKSGYYEKWNLD